MSDSFSAADLQAHIPRLRRYARALTGSRAAADDLTQETLEHAWRKRALWQPTGSLRAWLFTLMHRRFLNGLRRAAPATSLDDDDGGTHAEAPRTSASAAESGVVLAELQRALLALTDDQRAVVLLVGLEQLSYAEAASVLDVPIGTVMSRLSRGREQLRRLLDGQADGPALRRVK